jgi:phosphoglucomutase
LQDGSWVAVRPSGTEPKIKFYFAVVGSSMKESKRRIKELQQEVFKRIEINKTIKK